MSVTLDYRQFAQELAPRGLWFRDADSQSYLRALGGMAQDSCDLWRDTGRLHFASTGPEDALPRIGLARQIERAPREAVADYRERLQEAFEIHTDRTTDDAYRNALAPLGVAGADVFVFSYYEDCAIPAPWYADPWYSLVTIVVDATAGPWSEPTWDESGGDVWSEEESEDGVEGIDGLSPLEIRWLRGQIRKWKFVAAFPLCIIVLLAGEIWGDDSLWSEDDDDLWSEDDASTAVIDLAKVWDGNELLQGASPDLWTDDDDDDFWESEDPFDFEVMT